MSEQALAQRQCIPCRGGVPPLNDDEMASFSKLISPEWQIIERSTPKFPHVHLLTREYRVKDFAQAMQAAVRVGRLAEEQQHHPDLHVSWGKLGIEIWTHKIGGLTESDFIFAAKCDELLKSDG